MDLNDPLSTTAADMQPLKKRINLADYPNIIFKKEHFLNANEKYLVNSCNSYSN